MACARRIVVAPLAALAAAVLLLTAQSASALDIDHVIRSAALDQPRINLMMRTGATPATALTGLRFDMDAFFETGEFTEIPTVNIQAYLDTGASGILIGDFTAADFDLGRAMTAPPATPVIFRDVGVGGYDEFNVSQEVYIGLATYHPDTNLEDQNAYWQQAGTFRTQVGPIRPPENDITDLFAQIEQLFTNQEFNVVGMPAMMGKVTVVDSRFTNNSALVLGGEAGILEDIIENPALLTDFLNSLELRTSLHLPGAANIPKTSHHVNLGYGTFDRYTEILPAGSPGPTLAHNPFIGPAPGAAPSPSDPPKMKISYGGASTEASFLLDTGAAASIISTDMAEALDVRYKPGFEPSPEQDDPVLERVLPGGGTAPIPNQFKLTIAGVGQQITIAGFFLDSALVRTAEGNPLVDSDPNHLNFLGAPVLVHDIRLQDPDTGDVLTLDGIFGMNFLTAGVNVAPSPFGFEATDYAPGFFNWITFDEPNGVLGLSLNPFWAETLGDFNLNGELDPGDIDLLYDHLGDFAYDLDGDEDADQADVDAFLSLAGSLYGDADLDGGVGGLDYTRWRQRAGSGWAHGDFDGDGGVGGLDYTLWRTRPTAIAGHLSPGGGLVGVPEPGSFLLAVLGGALVGVMALRRAHG